MIQLPRNSFGTFATKSISWNKNFGVICLRARDLESSLQIITNARDNCPKEIGRKVIISSITGNLWHSRWRADSTALDARISGPRAGAPWNYTTNSWSVLRIAGTSSLRCSYSAIPRSAKSAMRLEKFIYTMTKSWDYLTSLPAISSTSISESWRKNLRVDNRGDQIWKIITIAVDAMLVKWKDAALEDSSRRVAEI